MQQRVPQFRLRSLTGLILISGFSLVVWAAIAFGVAQLQHANPQPCADHSQTAQNCPAGNR